MRVLPNTHTLPVENIPDPDPPPYIYTWRVSDVLDHGLGLQLGLLLRVVIHPVDLTEDNLRN